MGLLNLNLDALHVNCAASDRGGLRYTQLWAFQMFLPLFFPLILAIHLGTSQLLTWLAGHDSRFSRFIIRHGWRPRSDFSAAEISGMYLPPGLFFLNMYLMTGVKTSLEALKCNSDGLGGSFLFADPEITCWEGEHIPLAVGGFMGLAIYLFCVPAIYCWVLFYQLPRYGRDTQLAKAFTFVYGRFEPQWWWWELIESGRKVAFVFVTIFGQGSPREQSMVSLLAVTAVLVADLLCHPFTTSIYDVLEEALAVVEFVVLLAGLMLLSYEGTDTDWPNSMAIVVVIIAFILIGYVVLVDLDAQWQTHRAVTIRRNQRVTLDPALFNVSAYDDLILDWLEQAPPESLYHFREIEVKLMQARYGGAFKPMKEDLQYKAQLKALPFLLDNLASAHDGALPQLKAKDASADVNGLVAQYLTVFSDPPFNDMQPSSFFFMAKWRGPLARWLSHPAQQEARVYMHGFLKDIHAFDEVRQETMSRSTRVKKTLLLTTTKEMRSAIQDLEKSLSVFGKSPAQNLPPRFLSYSFPY